MAKFHKKEDIEKYEESWQKRFYIPSGDGKNYIHVCEICHNTNDVARIKGGHSLCGNCKKKLRLPKEKTIISWGERGIKISKEHNLRKTHPSNPSKKSRIENWKKIIKNDYMIELFNKNFEYDY